MLENLISLNTGLNYVPQKQVEAELEEYLASLPKTEEPKRKPRSKPESKSQRKKQGASDNSTAFPIWGASWQHNGKIYSLAEDMRTIDDWANYQCKNKGHLVSLPEFYELLNGLNKKQGAMIQKFLEPGNPIFFDTWIKESPREIIHNKYSDSKKLLLQLPPYHVSTLKYVINYHRGLEVLQKLFGTPDADQVFYWEFSKAFPGKKLPNLVLTVPAEIYPGEKIPFRIYHKGKRNNLTASHVKDHALLHYAFEVSNI